MQNSVGYIIGFCVAVCLVCSVIVSFSAVGLKEKQDVNKLLDKQTKVLTVAGLLEEGAAADSATVQDLFKKRIKAIVVDLKTGQADPDTEPSTFDQLKASKNPETSEEAPKNRAGVPRVPHKALVYQVSKTEMGEDGSGFELEGWIFPVEGKGLWSTLYGYISLAPDMNQIRGLIFYQHGETPGLGGEVDNPTWKAKWPNRLVFGPVGSQPSNWNDVKIGVIKGVAGTPEEAPHSVDGLSGATITSNGVTYLLRFWLGEPGFGAFIKNTLAGGDKTTAAVTVSTQGGSR